MTSKITPETIGIRPITAEEYVATKLDNFGGYDMSADPKLQGVNLNFSRIWEYQIAMNGQDPDALSTDIQQKIARTPVAQTVFAGVDWA